MPYTKGIIHVVNIYRFYDDNYFTLNNIETSDYLSLILLLPQIYFT